MKFFQRVADAHKRNNHINKLLVRVEIIEDEDNIENAIPTFYRLLYTKSELWRPTAKLDRRNLVT